MDWTLVVAATALMGIGALAILSASWYLPLAKQILQRHLLALAVGAGAFLFGLGLNYQIYQDQSKAAYGLALAMLAGVLVFGVSMRGTRGWFATPFFSFQPAEVARLLTLFVVADYLVRHAGRIEELSTVLGALALAAPVLALILAQPDFSSTLVLFPTLLCMLFCAGARLSHLAALSGAGAIAAVLPLVWTWMSLRPDRSAGALGAFLAAIPEFGPAFWATLAGIAALLAAAAWFIARMRWQVPWYHYAAVFLVLAGGLASGAAGQHALKEDQRRRFISFVSPEADPLGSGYNLRQSQIALGSGGFWGKGMFSGTQGRLGFLPERHTDFVFAVIGEESGFLGALTTLALYLVMLWRLTAAARGARDEFGYLVACALAGLFGSHLLINTGMAAGLLPVAGVPLPLVSYGGSSLVVSLWALGIAQSITIRRSGRAPGTVLS